MLLFSEEEIGEIIDITEEMCDQGGWVKEALPLAQKRMDIINNARTRLATSEQEIREKVLDEFKNWVIHDLVFCDSIGADHMFSHELILDKIDKLRSKQGGEQ